MAEGWIKTRDDGPQSVMHTTVIIVEFARGKGVDGDPIRPVRQIWSDQGYLLAECDIADEHAKRRSELGKDGKPCSIAVRISSWYAGWNCTRSIR